MTSTTALDHMVARLDALPPFPTYPHTCPALGGRSDLIFFHYSRASDDPVRIWVECLVPVSNGRLVKYGYGLGSGEAHWVDEGLL